MSTLAEEFLEDIGGLGEEAQEKEYSFSGIAEDSELNEFLNNHPSLPPYTVIITANTFISRIADETRFLARQIRENYRLQFPDLQQLVPDPFDYARVVLCIRDREDILNAGLADIVSSSVLMVIQMTYSHSSKQKRASPVQIATAVSAAEALLKLEGLQMTLLGCVSARIYQIAPNLTALLGEDVASRLVATSGGVKELAQIPACNISSIGIQAKGDVLAPRSGSGNIVKGILYDSDIVQDAPEEYAMKVIRILAPKTGLAARIDASGARDGSKGEQYRSDIESKLRKWLEPDAKKRVKPLAAPMEKPKSRRGGKRARKLKEKFRATELMKHKNRLAFGVAEESDVQTGVELGMLGQSGSGLRVAAKDTQKLSKAAARKLEKSRGAHGGASSGTLTAFYGSDSAFGTASTLSFTPFQGLELVNPTVKPKENESKYFSKTGWFKTEENKDAKE